MLRLALGVLTPLLLALQMQDGPPIAAESQPAASQPTDSRSSLTRPRQAEILEELLRQKQAPRPIPPQKTESSRAGSEPLAPAESDGSLLMEGTVLVERPGRLVKIGERLAFEFHPDEASPNLQTMFILENQWLEAMEREVESGASEFIISAEVTRYRAENYLLVRKVLRRVSHGNLSP